jgi:hypothetical protein
MTSVLDIVAIVLACTLIGLGQTALAWWAFGGRR